MLMQILRFSQIISNLVLNYGLLPTYDYIFNILLVLLAH